MKLYQNMPCFFRKKAIKSCCSAGCRPQAPRVVSPIYYYNLQRVTWF